MQAPNATVSDFSGQTTKGMVMIAYQNKTFTFTRAKRDVDGQTSREYWKCTNCPATLTYEMDPNYRAYIADPEGRHGHFNIVVGIQKIISSISSINIIQRIHKISFNYCRYAPTRLFYLVDQYRTTCC
jgi:hypothetical protein